METAMDTRRAGWVEVVCTWGGRAGIVALAVFWGWFVAMVGVSDIQKGLPGTGWVMAAWFSALALLTTAVWKWPRIGGPGLIAVSIGAAWYFQHPGAWALLAAPAAATGLLATIGAYAGRMPR
jgi:hypothetical protein